MSVDEILESSEEPQAWLADLELTRHVAEIGRSISLEDLPEYVLAREKCVFLDWLAAVFAGMETPLAQIMRKVVLPMSGSGAAGVFGGEFLSVGPVDAALVNGTTSHALDYDDSAGRTLTYGLAFHQAVSTVPAALALAQRENISGFKFLEALVAAQETMIRIAGFIGVAHRDQGWHATATMGTFGATAAGAKVLELDLAAWQMAFGIAGTQSTGLRAVFGTMCKPFHAGRAASNGVLSAMLAGEGFTSSLDILGAQYGFGWTTSSETHPERALRPLEPPYVAETVSFKGHASCGGTHCTIDAMAQLRAEGGFTPEEIDRIIIRVPEPRTSSCNIAEPKTGLEGKFSLRFTATASLHGWDTTGACFTDAVVTSPTAVDLMNRITVEGLDLPTVEGPTEVEVFLRDGRHLSRRIEDGGNVRPHDWDTLSEKYLRLATAAVGEELAVALHAIVADLEHLSSMREFHERLVAGARR